MTTSSKFFELTRKYAVRFTVETLTAVSIRVWMETSDKRRQAKWEKRDRNCIIKFCFNSITAFPFAKCNVCHFAKFETQFISLPTDAYECIVLFNERYLNPMR